MPNSGLSDCLRRSPSMRMTRLPSAASASARFEATVVLPSPGTVLVMRTTFAPCFEQKRGSLAAGALSAAHGGDGGEAGQTDEAVQVLGRVNGAARQGEQRHKDEAEDQPDDAAADAGLQSRVGVDGRSGRLDRLVNDLDLRVAQNGGRRSGVDLDGGQQRVIDGLRIAARCRQREQGGIRHRAGRQADGSTLIAQLLLEQQLHAIALQDIGERG